MRKLIVLIILYTISCRYEVEKRFIPDYEELFNKELYEESVHAICMAAQDGENLSKLEEWFKENYFAIKGEYETNQITIEEDVSLSALEAEMESINSELTKNELLILKETKKNINNLTESQKEEVEKYNQAITDKKREKQENDDKLYYYKNEVKKWEELIESANKELKLVTDEENLIVIEQKIKDYKSMRSECNRAIEKYKRFNKQLNQEIGEIQKSKSEFLIANGAAPDPAIMKELKESIVVLKNKRLLSFKTYIYGQLLLTIKKENELFSFAKMVKKYLKLGKINRLVIP